LFAVTGAERDRVLADPRVAPTDVETLLAPGHLLELVGKARGLLAEDLELSGEASRPHPGDTVAVVTADRDGRFVSLIQSVYLAFGSGLLEPRTGIVLHDRGACFTLDPSSPNVLRAGARPAHTLMPVLVSRDGAVVAAHGTRGGEAQPQIHAQLVMQLAAGADPEEAVSRPRWVLDATEDEGTLAEVDLPDRTLTALARTGRLQRLPARDDAVGHAQIVRATDRGLEAGSDPRADGVALAG
jgi:gamma-glutamyltranspeptidase/glutathione hydrolase